MSLEGLQERLIALQETTSQLKELIDRLASLKFQPGSVPLNIEEEGSVSGELSAEISTVLRGGLEDQQLLCEEAKYVRPDGHEKTRLQDGIERVGGELSSYRSALRKARLSAKKSLEHAQRLERELMIQSFVEPVSDPTAPPTVANEEAAPTTIPRAIPLPRYGQHHHQNIQSSISEKDRQTVNASSNLTNALQRTHALMTAELTRSEFAHQMLAESSEALGKLDESYMSLDNMLASSKDLLGTLLRSQKSDTWYLQTARYMLLVTVACKVSVDGLPDESLPTVNVGDDTVVVVDGSDADAESMIEKVGKIIDAAREADELGSIPDGDELEEAEGKVEEIREDSRPRDEL
ncbi:hypothetical protein PT974_08921 [Cladobotryum mycophilum]|uniref:Sec20 C-terminal domain-containing protein n=1 Tax=Cladobotryum mycophilum TaxID=491253 RepID=A0ABR0SER3_9HYPO